jgi:hypothetical protein
MKTKHLNCALSLLTLAVLSACGGGGGGSNGASQQTATPQQVSLPFVVSDASSEDWATISVKVLAISLTKADGTKVPVDLGPNVPLPLNLAQLDQLGELISNVTLTAGDTYLGATLTLSANPGDVSLVSSANPEAGFLLGAGTAVNAGDIQIQGTSGAAGSKTVTVDVKFDSPLVVPSTPNTAINIEVDLGHPSFIVGHAPVGTGTTVWAVNFDKGPVRHHPVDALDALVLRHMYGKVTTISSDNTTLTIDKLLPTAPVVTPETAVDTQKSVSVLADSANKTLFYDLDAKTSTAIADFSSVSQALAAGKYVRVAARYQQNGTLVATRIWVSANFDSVWVSPEGHLLRVDKSNNRIVVADENGKPVSLLIDANTQFYFRAPESAVADATPIGSGTAFLAANNLVRGFKVHAQVVDPLASPMVAQSIDIETAAFEGKISSVTNSGFIYSKSFAMGSDGYAQNMAYIDASTPNGKDASGAALTGFKFWNFAYPTLLDSGTGAIPDFTAATGGAVNFGGTVGQVFAYGASYAIWGNKANTNGWSAPFVVLEPTPLPRAKVSTAFANNQFAITLPNGANPVTVDVGTTSAWTSLAYQVDRTKDVVTVTPEDLTTTAGLTALTNGLAQGATVSVSAVPQADGTLKAYVITYYTGVSPK